MVKQCLMLCVFVLLSSPVFGEDDQKQKCVFAGMETWKSCESEKDCEITRDVCGLIDTVNWRHSVELRDYNTCIAPRVRCPAAGERPNREDFHAQCEANKCVVKKGPGSKFAELKKRLHNLKSNEKPEDVLAEYVGDPQEAPPVTQVLGVPSAESLAPCSFMPFNAAFLCDSKWSVDEEEGMVVYTISKSPAVRFTITKITDSMKYLALVTKEDLIKTEQYADGFLIEETIVKRHNAKVIKGFARSAPHIRYLDYYILKDTTLYSVLFSVDPKETWDSYKFLIKTIAESVEFK